MLLPSTVSAASSAFLASSALFTENAVVRTVTTTIHPEYTTTYVVEGQTEELVVAGSPGVVEVGGVTTTLDIPAMKTSTWVYGTTIDIGIEPQPLGKNFEFTGRYGSIYFTERAPFATTWLYPGTILEVSIPERQTTFVFTSAISTEVVIPPEHTHLIVAGMETTVTFPSLTTLIEASHSAYFTLQLPATTTTLEIGGETFEFTVNPDTIYGDDSVRFCGTNNGQTLTSPSEAVLSGPCIVGTTFTLTLPTSTDNLHLHADGLTTEFTLPGIATTFVPERTLTIVGDRFTTTSIIPAVVSSYVTTISNINISPIEKSSISEESSITSKPDLGPTLCPTYCEVSRGPLTPEEEVQLQVLFSEREGASTFADYVVSYASQLVAQIADVTNIAIGDNDYDFTTFFDFINISGILGLASAAPVYTCFLSSLWAEALSNPQQYAKRVIPTQDENIKLTVLFEKHENSDVTFDYAELLIDDTIDLIADIRSVSAAAADGDLGAYVSLFASVNVPYFLSIATEAPIYTEGLSAALQTALASYSESLRPTVTAMTTRTYTVVNTITTDVVNGTVTIPTTYYSTEIFVTVEPVGQAQRTSTTVQVAPAPTANAPANKVTTEVVTLGNGRVETRTVTIREETRAPAAAETTRRPNVAVYTQVQNGVTYTHTIEIQTKNAALKKVAALGAGILGGAALLL